MTETLKHWLTLSRPELDDIYRQATPGPLPVGDTRGTAIVAGSGLSKVFAQFARLFAWQGKVFDNYADDGNAGVLINKITPFSLNFIVAKVYRDLSWMDGKDTIAIDYSHTSFFAHLIRDEIRQVEPGLYLGKVWWRQTRILDFALTVPEQISTRGPVSGRSDRLTHPQRPFDKAPCEAQSNTIFQVTEADSAGVASNRADRTIEPVD